MYKDAKRIHKISIMIHFKSFWLDEDLIDRYRWAADQANHDMRESEMRWPTGPLEDEASHFEALARDLRAVEAADFNVDAAGPVELENWRLTERSVLSLAGVSLGHPVLGTKPIRTSQVFFLDLELGIARSFSRWYRLGMPFQAPPSLSMQ
jgi:hypothetical protein